jgi:dienelactone hydrolase
MRILLCIFFTATLCADPEKVVRTSVRQDGLVATLLQGSGDRSRLGLIVVGGSEGGIRGAEWFAWHFAKEGWAALALAYFGHEGLPETLADIPLEYFDRAVAWLSAQPLIESRGISIVGTSRGAEIALLVAAYNPLVNRVICYAPTHVVWGPVALNADALVSSWTRMDRRLAFMPSDSGAEPPKSPYRGTPNFLLSLQRPEAVKAAAIPVERIQGAVLLLSGEDDQLWPSTLMADAIVSRLRAYNHPYRFEHVSFPGAGHAFVPGIDAGLTEIKHPLGITLVLGGSREANSEAQKKAWTKVLAFLRSDIRGNE